MTNTTLTFRIDSTTYTTVKEGYYYAQADNGKKHRICREAFDNAYTEYVNSKTADEIWQAQADLEREQQEIAKQAQAEADEKAVLGDTPKLPEGYTIKSTWDGDCTSYRLFKDGKMVAADWTVEPLYEKAQKDASEATEKAQDSKTDEQPSETKKAKRKPRRSKDVALEATLTSGAKLTLTRKQVDFMKHFTDSCYWENGLESAIWCDIFCDEIGGQFAGKPMTVGAMISTLREKSVIYVGVDRINGKKAKYFGLTDLGKKIASHLGLN